MKPNKLKTTNVSKGLLGQSCQCGACQTNERRALRNPFSSRKPQGLRWPKEVKITEPCSIAASQSCLSPVCLWRFPQSLGKTMENQQGMCLNLDDISCSRSTTTIGNTSYDPNKFSPGQGLDHFIIKMDKKEHSTHFNTIKNRTGKTILYFLEKKLQKPSTKSVSPKSVILTPPLLWCPGIC